VYTTWASHCDIRPYTGWIIGYDEHTLAQTSVLNITPNGNEAAIWMSGGGLAVDTASNIYLMDRTNMGKFNPGNDNAIYQELDGALPDGIWSMPAYFNSTPYYGSVGYHLQAFPFQNARLNAASSQTAISFAYPGTTPSVSANGTSNAIVWATENTSPAILHAYAAANLGVEYYNSSQAAGSRDNFGNGNKFITPTIASARVYVGTTSGVGVFGLLDQSTLTPLEVWRNSNFGNPSNVGEGADNASPAGDGVRTC